MIIGSIGTVSSSWEPPIPMSGLMEWYEPGNTAGIIIANPPATDLDEMINLANPMGSPKYQQLFVSEFGSDLLGATTITTNATSNSWSNSTDWSSMTEYTVIIISKYNDPSNNQENTFTNLGGPVTFNLGNGNNGGIGKINVCQVGGLELYAGDTANILWAMYTLCGSTTIKLNFYRNANPTSILSPPANFRPLPVGTLIFPFDMPYTSSSVGAVLLYNRIITNDERNSIFQHYKKQFPLLDT